VLALFTGFEHSDDVTLQHPSEKEEEQVGMDVYAAELVFATVNLSCHDFVFG